MAYRRIKQAPKTDSVRKKYYKEQLAFLAGVGVRSIRWTYFRQLKSGEYSGKCVINAPGCVVTTFKLSTKQQKDGSRMYRFEQV